jgi:hypothetical protein
MERSICGSARILILNTNIPGKPGQTKMKKLHSGILLGVLSATAVSLAVAFHWPSWVIFLAWISYYVFGKSVKTALQTLLQMLLGITMGIFIELATKGLSVFLGGFSLPITVFLLVGSLAFLTSIKPLNNVFGWNLGLILYFGVHPKVEIIPMLSLLAPVLTGFTFAWINDSMRQILAIDKK